MRCRQKTAYEPSSAAQVNPVHAFRELHITVFQAVSDTYARDACLVPL